MEKQNVILISLLPPPYGGIAQWTKKLIEIAPKFNLNIKLVDESNSSERKHFGDNTRRNIFNDIKRMFRIHKDLKKALKSTDKSYVVHCCIPSLRFSMMRELYNLKLVKKYKRKYIIHFRSTVANNVRTDKEKKLLKKILIKADKIILLNQKSLDFCNSIYPNNKMVVLPNFIDSKETDANHVINDNIKNALYVGMATKEKGVDDIIDVAPFFPSINFNIIGRVSPEIDEYIKINNPQNVKLLGPMDKDKILEYYKSSDLFFFLSRFRSEGFSNALCEAMGMGLPCIVTDWASNKEMVFESDEFSVVNSHDIEQLKKSITHFENKDIRKKASRANYNKVMNEYIEPVVINKLIDIYKSIV